MVTRPCGLDEGVQLVLINLPARPDDLGERCCPGRSVEGKILLNQPPEVRGRAEAKAPRLSRQLGHPSLS